MGNSLFHPAQILLPQVEEPARWPVLACDQFTSQPEYWENTEKIVGAAPSTLRLVLPEAYLEQPDVGARTGAIHAAMRAYTADGTLSAGPVGFVYLRRTFANGHVREGLVGCVDLEDYSYEPGAAPRIRPSENTVVERIPPRLAVRRGAPLECPHILMLIDDAGKTVIEPLATLASQPPLYDIELMQGGGRLQGWAVTQSGQIKAVQQALAQLEDARHFHQLYGAAGTPFAMAVGDGNHSLATAKAHWEELKPTLTAQQRQSHPARMCLVELENIQSPAIGIEPIHRVVFGTDAATLLHRATVFAANSGARLSQASQPTAGALEPGAHHITVVLAGKRQLLRLENSAWPLAVAAVEAFLDEFTADYPAARVDYVHGEAAVEQLAAGGALGILLPPFEKSDLFRGVALGGVLPRKTFSMGHAEQKRYYMECRRIIEE